MGNMIPPREPLTRDDYRKNAEDALILAGQTARSAASVRDAAIGDSIGLAAVAQARIANGWIALLNTPGGR